MPGGQCVVSPAERDALLIDDHAAEAASVIEVETTRAPEPETADDLPESMHDEGEPAPLDDGPEEVTPSVDPVMEEPPQWEFIRSRVGRTRNPPPRVRDAA